ncbi:MAG: metal ABC transporter permease, partial [Pseudomonadota bacterium]
MVGRVLPYLWPRGDSITKLRVVTVLILLVIAKLISVGTPMLLAETVDTLAGEAGDLARWITLGAVALTVSYGAARLLNTGFQELRGVIFAPVAQRALRKLGLETFRQIHALSLRYHISRKTG